MDSTLTFYALLSLAVAACAVLSRRFFRSASNLPHPPGPPGLPILGNLFDRPKEHAWITYRKWSQQYGSNLIRLNVLGSNVVIINSAEVASDLLEKRGTLYSDRPSFTMLRELCGFFWNTSLLPYGTAWKNARKVFQREIGPLRVQQYRPQMVKGVQRLLSSSLSAPEDILDHFKLLAGAHILGVAYGLDVCEASDPYIEDAKTSSGCFSAAAYPGAYAVDSLPFLKYVPEWFPGAHFRREAREWTKTNMAVRDRPFEAVKARMAQGESFACAAKGLLDSIDLKKDSSLTENDIRSALGTMYIAGADTVVSSLGFFAYAMVVHPEIQAKAQQIIDEICPGRLPTFDDMPDLPFIDGLVKETLRWRPVLPLGIPHQTSEDDIYNGLFIPKGSQVIENSWAILQDEEMYPEPEKFKPERWLKDGQLNTDIREPDVAFGGGRRICPGRYMAYESMWISVACLLATFEFKKVKDAHGNVIEPEEELAHGVVCHIKPFPFDIVPRSKEHCEIIRNTCNDD